MAASYDGSIVFNATMDTTDIQTGTNMISTLCNKGKLAVVAAATAAVAAVGSFAKSVVETGSSFESAMSQLAATMGTTVDQIQDLEAKAKEMGSTTAFTATEAAEGLNVLAQAGYNASEQCEMIGPVLNLASAGATTMDSAASYLTTTLKGYNVASQDTGKMTEYYSDLMAKGATLVNTSVDELGEAMSKSAATSNAYGQSVETTTTALLAMADGGITGSQAATYLGRMMTNLYAPTSSARKAMEELTEATGINCTAYDEDTGKTRDFMDVIFSLSDAFDQCDEATANQYKSTILGQVGLKGFNVIAGKSQEELETLTANLTDCTGAAQQMADTQLDNLEGDVTLLNSAVDGLKIQLFETVEGPLRSIVQFTTNSIIPAIETIIDHLPLIISILAGVTAGVVAYEVATNAATIADAADTAAKLALSTACEVLAVAMDSIPFVAVAAAIGAGVTALILFVQHMSNSESASVQLKNELKDLEDQIDDTNASFEETKASNEATIETYRAMADELVGLAGQTDLTASQQERLNYLCQAFEEAGLELTYDEVTGAVEISTDAVYDFCDSMEKELTYNTGVDELNALLDEQAELERISADALAIMTGETDANAFQVAQAANTYNQAQLDLQQLNGQIDEAQQLVDELNSELEEEDDIITGSVEPAVQDFWNSINDLATAYAETYDAAYESMQGQFELWDKAGEVAVTSMEDLQAALDSQQEYWAQYEENMEILKNSGIDGMDQLLNSFDTTSTQGVAYVASLAEGVKEGSFDMQSYVTQATEGMNNSWQGAAEVTAEATTDFSNSVQEAVDNCMEAIEGLDMGDQAYEEAIQTLEGYLEGLDDEESGVTDEVRAIVEAICGEMEDRLEMNSPSRVFKEYGENTGKGYVEGLDEMPGMIDESLSASISKLNEFDSQATSITEQAGQNSLNNITTAFSQIPTEVGSNSDLAITNIKTWATGTIEQAKDGASTALSNVSEYIGKIPSTVESDTSSALNSFSSWNKSITSEAKSAGSGVLDNINSSFSEIPGKVETQLNSTLNNFNSWSKNISSASKSAASDVLSNINSSFSEIPGKVQSSLNSALTNFNSWSSSITSAAKSAASDVLSNIDSSFSQIPGKIESSLNSALSSFNSWSSNITSAAKSAASNVYNEINEKFSEIPGKIDTHLTTALTKFETWSTSMTRKATETTKTILDDVNSKFQEIVTRMEGYLSTALNNVTTWGNNVVNRMKETGNSSASAIQSSFSSMASQITSILNGITNTVVSWGNNLVTNFTQIGKNVFQGMINGMNSMVGSLYSSIESSLSGLVQQAENSLGIGSPSKVFAEEVGAWIPPGIEEGFKDMMPDLQLTTEKEMRTLVQEMQADVEASSKDISLENAAESAYRSARDGFYIIKNGSDDERYVGEIHTHVELSGKEVGYVVTPFVNTNFARDDSKIRRGG